MRFPDLSPEAMRLPSVPGQTVLDDRGENLSSVIQGIGGDAQRKASFIHWVQALTPMAAADVAFPTDAAGRILLTLVEANGQQTTANSASDGTLRFLAMLAAMLGPEPAQFYFFEELDTGIHPTRLRLLLQLVERQVERGATQVVATTHSPQLLRLLSRPSLDYAALTYRLPDRPDTRVRRILDLAEAPRIIDDYGLARLHESGWLEDTADFMEPAETIG